MNKLIFVLFISTILFANPMLVKSKPQSTEGAVKISIMAPVINNIVMIQRDIRNDISRKTKAIKQEPSSGYLAIILFAVFLYGFFHALGPGHGKVIAVSYFVGTKAPPIKGIVFGFVFSLMHSFSALFLFAGMLLLSKIVPVFGGSGYEAIMQKISYYIISILGVYIVYKGVKTIRKKSCSEEEHVHHALLPFVLGIVPCPGTLLFLTYFASHKMLWLGLLSVVLIALGMASALSILSIMVIVFREKALIIFDSDKTKHFGNYLTIFGGTSLVVLGIYLSQ